MEMHVHVDDRWWRDLYSVSGISSSAYVASGLWRSTATTAPANTLDPFDEQWVLLRKIHFISKVCRELRPETLVIRSNGELLLCVAILVPAK